ncbi:plasmid mobilization protein [Belliella aquatica]|uniref:Mobilization protein n=1 Tax=Belliella aquatica TaxID=1323734 RepID=A0ABQ1MBK3_9BACT|nr:hypothetical protein [Belliella aquatica]MCH7406332.1 hypothetical protein [Belliella aquatica]GGC37901.1 hypothetical protein GCM10010993_16030 [Belliella aquatica]
MNSYNNKNQGYPRRVESRISEAKFQELLGILSRSQNLTMSGLIRDILSKNKLVVTTYDRGLDIFLEQLSTIYQEINSVGININQLTKFFHQTGDLSKKLALVKKVEARLEVVLEKQDQLKNCIQPLLEKWLQK